MKLGEFLIKRELLTASELEVALRSQLILGGHLGTSLIELGLIDEDTLGGILSEMCRAPYAPPHLFERLSEATIGAIPAKIAVEYQAVPIKVEGKFVHLAVIDPKDLKAIDELAFAIGRKIIPWVAPEVRIQHALEEYYGVQRKSRFVSLSVQLDEARKRNKVAAAKAKPVKASSVPERDTARESTADEVDDRAFGYGKPWREIAEQLDRREASATTTSGPRSPLSLSELAKRYCCAESADDLALAALEFCVGRAARVLLVKVRGRRATVWHERGLDLDIENRRAASFDVSDEAVFQLVADVDRFSGAYPAGKDFHSFYRTLGVAAPAELLMVPIRVNGSLVAVAFADGEVKGDVRGHLLEMTAAFHLLAPSISLVAMKQKILDAALRQAEEALAHATTTVAAHGATSAC